MNETEEIKAKLDIVDVIGGYVQLKQAGRNYKGLSPFKIEKTPSFMVSPEKNIWHDFSSGRGGDVISFVMEVEGLSFPEALEMLAQRAGVKLKPRKPGEAKKSQKKIRLYEVNKLAMQFFYLTLSKNEPAKAYFMKERGLKIATIKQFKLGYSNDSWNSLSDYLLKQGFTREELIEAGVAAKSNRKIGVYDLFRGRAMFPVFDTQGRVVGFSARLLGQHLDGQRGAKYINTPQTVIYNKSFVIYGLAQAKESIRNEDRVVIVEGNMDVLALYNAGFKNTIACSGTALTEQQLRQLHRLTKNITLCFDSDEAGVNATLRAIDLASASDIKIDVIDLNKAKDPDELLKKDIKLWEKAVKEAQYAPDFIIELGKKRYDLSTAPGKKQFGSFVAPLLRSLSNDIELQHYTKKIAQLIGVNEESIQKLFKKPEVPKPAIKEPTEEKPKLKSVRKLNRQEKLEQELLELTLAYPQTRSALKDLHLKQTSKLHRNIFKFFKSNINIQLDDIVKELPKEGNYVKILALRGEQQFVDLTAHDIRLEAFTQVARIQELDRQQNKRQLARELAEAEQAGDNKQARILLRQYQELLNED